MTSLAALCCTICLIVSVVSFVLADSGVKTRHAADRLGSLLSEVSRRAQPVNKLAAIVANVVFSRQCTCCRLFVCFLLLGLRVPFARLKGDPRLDQRLQQHAQNRQQCAHVIFCEAVTRPQIARPAAPTPTALMIQSTICD